MEVLYTINQGYYGFLDLCPLWWQNFIIDIRPLSGRQIDKYLLDNWGVICNYYFNAEYFTIKFPSEEAAFQFMLIYA
jgi:hypothetical protein